MKRKVAIFTGNRAEYGLQYPIIKAIAAHPDLEYFLLASGAHLQEDFGMTKGEIEKDGFKVYREVRLTMNDDSLLSTAQAIGSGILNLSQVLAEIQPDFLVVYADRFEGFAAVVTGTQMNIPTAHVEGGDLTEGGALDDSVRHAMTKLAHLHFTTHEEAADRVRLLGEEPWRIHNIGFPAIDLIADGRFATAKELLDRYGIDDRKSLVVFTQHSVTTEFNDAAEQVRPSLAALRRLAAEGCQVLVTYPNNDAGGKTIIREINLLADETLPNLQVHASVGRYYYHGMLSLCGTSSGVCAGNSSSGIKETPVFGCPAVNIGSRQLGRLRGDNVIDADYDEDSIYAACRKALDDANFRKQSRDGHNPYGAGGSGKRIAEILATVELGTRLVRKKMTY